MQPDLLDFALTPSTARKRRPTVRHTSKLAVTVKRDSGTLQARAADIAHWLAWMANCPGTIAPTTVELATWLVQQHRGTGVGAPGTSLDRFVRLDPTARKNYIAKGIWDCQSANVVEAVPHGERVCAVNQRKATVWRLRAL